MFFIDSIPGGDVGLAVIAITILVKLLLFPISLSATRTQIKMKVAEPEIKAIQEKYKDNRELLGKETLAIYVKHKINPFASIISLFIQIPVVIALYFALAKGLPSIQTHILYSFIAIPEKVNMMFLGLVDVSKNQVFVFAFLAAVTQYFQTKLLLPKMDFPKRDIKDVSFKEEMMKGMHIQMRYVMPIVTFIAAYSFMSVVAIYWTVSNMFAIGQEYYIRKTLKK